MQNIWEVPPTTQASVSAQPGPSLQRWWQQFQDPELNSLIDRAVATNLDLEAANERIHAARALVGVATGGILPTVDGTGNYLRGGGANLQWQSTWTSTLNGAYQVDVFGGARRAIEQADANLDASLDDKRNVLVTVLGEVATDYMQLRGEQQEVKIAKESLEVDERNAKVTRDKKTLGTGTNLDIAQADSEVASTNAALITLEASAQQTIYALSVLLALPPTALEAELSPEGKVPDPPTQIPAGLPSELLRRRPDIRQAERLIAAANAGIGVQVAQLFPQFSLTGSVGLQASRIDLMTNWKNSFWSFGPSVTWSILDAGIIRSNIDLQYANTEQAVTAYRKTILTALQNVQTVLVSYAQELHRRVALEDAVRFNQQAVRLSSERYDNGQTDFLAVLDAERTLFASQDALVLSNEAVSSDAVQLYVALGGGWEIDSPAATTQAVKH
jgi:NodT family efflux transporter outer membrane factor (OMF) lipoprotein